MIHAGSSSSVHSTTIFPELFSAFPSAGAFFPSVQEASRRPQPAQVPAVAAERDFALTSSRPPGFF